MIRSFFGLDQNPFSHENVQLLQQQQEIFDTLRVHSQQGGLCIIIGEPGTGKSVVKNALVEHDSKRVITPVVNRTLHTYFSTPQVDGSETFGFFWFHRLAIVKFRYKCCDFVRKSCEKGSNFDFCGFQCDFFRFKFCPESDC